MSSKLCHLAFGALFAAALIAPSLADPLQFASESTVAVRDRFSDEIVGQGPDIVFIPGLASSRETWKAEARRLKAHYRVHLIQLAGFAGEPSRANASGAVLVPTAEAIDAYLVERHLTPATVIGHSLGGTMLIYLAERHPADIRAGLIVDSLPFYATLMGGPSATVDGMKPIADKIRANSAPMDPARYDQMIKSMASAPADQAMIRAWGKASDGAVVANAMADDLTLDLRPGLPRITARLTLLYPDYVPIGTPPGATTAMYAGAYATAPGVKLVPITNALHFIMLDQPAQFETALDAFLAN